MGNLPSVLNAMTGFEYAMGGVEISSISADELPTLVGDDLIFAFPIKVDGEMTHHLILDPAFAKQVAAALTGGEVGEGEDLALNEMEMSAISEVMSQANGSYLTNLSAAMKTSATGESVSQVDAEAAAGTLDENSMIASIQLEQADSAITVRHLIPGPLAQQVLAKLKQDAQPAPEPAPAPAPQPAPQPQAQPQQQAAPAQAAAPPASSGNVRDSGSTQYSPASFSQLSEPQVDYNTRNLDMLMDVPLQVTVELGKTQIPIKQILEYGQGSLITLDKLAGEPIDLLVNGKYFAKGEVVVIDENFGVRITSILSPAERIAQLS
jgi:flagellar motor switch protein FliN/FliY